MTTKNCKPYEFKTLFCGKFSVKIFFLLSRLKKHRQTTCRSPKINQKMEFLHWPITWFEKMTALFATDSRPQFLCQIDSLVSQAKNFTRTFDHQTLSMKLGNQNGREIVGIVTNLLNKTWKVFHSTWRLSPSPRKKPRERRQLSTQNPTKIGSRSIFKGQQPQE